MARFVLVATLAALAGCYDPALVDCAQTCGTSGLCPDGLACVAGFCREPGATTTCGGVDASIVDTASIDTPSTIDAPAPVDAPLGGCPPPPLPTGCTPMSMPPLPPACLMLCAAVPGTTATTFRQGAWRVAAVTDAQRGAAVTALAGAQSVWVGLTQPAAAPSPMAGWTWSSGAPVAFTAWAGGQPDDGDGVENGAEQCGAVSGGTWSDEACATSRPFVMEPL